MGNSKTATTVDSPHREEVPIVKPTTVIGKINYTLGELGKYLFGVAIVISVYEVFARYVLNKPTIWVFEATVILCATGYFVAGGYVTQQNKHIGITVIREMVSEKTKFYLEMFGYFAGIFAMSILMWSGWDPAFRALKYGERAGTPWNPPTPQILKPMIVIGAALIVLQLLSNLYVTVKNRKETTRMRAESPSGESSLPNNGHTNV